MKTFIFDLDDTLYDVSVPYFQSLQAENIQIDEKIKPALFLASREYSDVYYHMEKRKEINTKQMYIGRIKHALSDFGIIVSDEKAWKIHEQYLAFQKRIELSQRMIDLIEFLKDHGQIAIITNGPSQHQWSKINQLQLERWFDHDKIIVSDDIGCGKPELGIFQEMLMRCQCQAQDCYFIGDSYPCDIVGSVSSGMQAIYYNHRRREVQDSIATYTVTQFDQLDQLLRTLAIKENE